MRHQVSGRVFDLPKGHGEEHILRHAITLWALQGLRYLRLHVISEIGAPEVPKVVPGEISCCFSVQPYLMFYLAY